uniref:Serine/arginine repetitive matrix protein 1-like n=1 Tax=Davidia involucrata TaxID=16924 RepID=A0A5B7BHC6_DAVIN
MGCCLCTNNPPKTSPDVVDTKGSRDPPSLSPPPEEESVKEVLSETPIPKPPPNNKKIEATAAIKPPEEIISEASEVSEICSFSEGLSTTTREDDGEVNQRVHKSPARVPRQRPYYGEFAGRKERGPRSPARSETSPEKRSCITSSRSAQGQTTTTTTKRLNVGPPNGIRREPGEGSGWRSRSPAAGPRPVRHKSPSSTTTGRSGDRSPVVTAENGGKLEKPDGDMSPETGESLENPLVSLECFIFL